MTKTSEKIKEKVVKKRAERKEKIAAVKRDVKRAVQKKIGNPNTVTSNRLKLLITIVGRSKAEYYVDLLQSFEINMQMVAMAHGTADANMLGLL